MYPPNTAQDSPAQHTKQRPDPPPARSPSPPRQPAVSPAPPAPRRRTRSPQTPRSGARPPGPYARARRARGWTRRWPCGVLLLRLTHNLERFKGRFVCSLGGDQVSKHIDWSNDTIGVWSAAAARAARRQQHVRTERTHTTRPPICAPVSSARVGERAPCEGRRGGHPRLQAAQQADLLVCHAARPEHGQVDVGQQAHAGSEVEEVPCWRFVCVMVGRAFGARVSV